MGRQILNWIAGIVIRVFIILLPSLLVLYTLSTPVVKLSRAISEVKIPRSEMVHEMLPKTRWNHILSCGQFFNEQEQFDIAKSCAVKLWNDPKSVDSIIPRCYVVSSASPDVFSSKKEEGDPPFNFVPVAGQSGISAVVGVYQPSTMTIFLVENSDMEDVYRHELQHHFLHDRFPETQGSGHFQDIWSQCESQYYRSERFSKRKIAEPKK